MQLKNSLSEPALLGTKQNSAKLSGLDTRCPRCLNVQVASVAFVTEDNVTQNLLWQAMREPGSCCQKQVIKVGPRRGHGC